MRLGLVLNTADPETAWNAFRLGVTSLRTKHQVKVFLLGRGVEIEQIQDTKLDVAAMIQKFLQAGGEILACGTCLKLRNKEGLSICPVSSMADLLQMVEASDRVLTFS
jgi:uncharacterized protein involved in oxidation of intracellular sulfur